MTRPFISRPSGQAMAEAAAVLLGFVSLFAAVTVVYRVAESALVTTSEARFDLDRCRLDPSLCADWLAGAAAHQGPGGYSAPVQSQLQAASAPARHLLVESAMDQPPAKVSGTDLVSSVQESLIGIADGLAHELFELPDGRLLLRIQSSQRSTLGGADLEHQTGLALVTDDWSSATVAMAQDRVQSGAEPSEAIRLAAELAYLPVTDALMPLAESLSLEEGSEALTNSFHRRDWMQSFPGLSTPLR